MAREVILAKLSIDSRGRMFISKEVRNVLDFRPGDEIVITKNGGLQQDNNNDSNNNNSFILSVQRGGEVITIWHLIRDV